MNALLNFAPYLKTLGNNIHDFSYPDTMLRKLWTKMKNHVYFEGIKKRRKKRDGISCNIVELRQGKIRAEVQLYCTLHS